MKALLITLLATSVLWAISEQEALNQLDIKMNQQMEREMAEVQGTRSSYTDNLYLVVPYSWTLDSINSLGIHYLTHKYAYPTMKATVMSIKWGTAFSDKLIAKYSTKGIALDYIDFATWFSTLDSGFAVISSIYDTVISTGSFDVAGYGYVNTVSIFPVGSTWYDRMFSYFYQYDNGTGQYCKVNGTTAKYSQYISDVVSLWNGVQYYDATSSTPTSKAPQTSVSASVQGEKVKLSTSNLKTGTVEIYDLRGKILKELHSGDLNGSMQFDIKDLADQMMILKIRSDKGEFNQILKK